MSATKATPSIDECIRECVILHFTPDGISGSVPVTITRLPHLLQVKNKRHFLHIGLPGLYKAGKLWNTFGLAVK